MQLLPPEILASLQPVADNNTQEGVDEEQARKIKLAMPLFSAQTLPDVLLQLGIDNRRYRLLHRAEHSDYQLFFNASSENPQQWLYIASHNNKQQLTQFCHQLQRWLIQLNQNSEGLYIVEPILLRTEENNASWRDYANRVTVVFPGYTARFSNLKFREQVEQLVIENSPAHLLVQCQWLDFSAFSQFETLYTRWRQAKSRALQRRENQPECDAIAKQLYPLIQPPQDATNEALKI